MEMNSDNNRMDILYPVSTFDQIGQHFLRTGRPVFSLEKCIVIAYAEFRFVDGNVLPLDIHSWSECDSTGSLHAEYLVVQRLQETENKTDSDCSNLLMAFLDKRPLCKLYLHFSSIFRVDQHEHCSALRKLKNHPQIESLDVFKEEDWQFLSLRGNLHLSLADLQWMRHFDTFWRYKLERILQVDPISECALQDDQALNVSNATHNTSVATNKEVLINTQLQNSRIKKSRATAAFMRKRILLSQLSRKQGPKNVQRRSAQTAKSKKNKSRAWRRIMQFKKMTARKNIAENFTSTSKDFEQ